MHDFRIHQNHFFQCHFWCIQKPHIFHVFVYTRNRFSGTVFASPLENFGGPVAVPFQAPPPCRPPSSLATGLLQVDPRHTAKANHMSKAETV